MEHLTRRSHRRSHTIIVVHGRGSGVRESTYPQQCGISMSKINIVCPRMASGQPFGRALLLKRLGAP